MPNITIARFVFIVVLSLSAAAQRIEVAYALQLTEGARIQSAAFSPEGKRLAFVDVRERAGGR